MLIETLAYMPPARALEHLSAEDAQRPLPGANHTIAEILAHLVFWQDLYRQRCEGKLVPMPASAAGGWPQVTPGSWPDLRARFLDGLDRVAALGEPSDRLDRAIAPAIEVPQFAHFTVRDMLIHIATHNAHHLGQVVVLEQILGLWPPPSGSWTF